MKREHRHLSERLNVLESALANQDKRITIIENNDGSVQDARITDISNQVRSLQESDIAERLAGLAGELRETRQQTERTRDKLRDVEKAARKHSSAACDKDSAVQERFVELEHHLSLLRAGFQAFERRLELMAHDEVHAATEKMDASNKQHCARFEALEEQLRQFKQAQDELRALHADSNHAVRDSATISKPTNPSQQPSGRSKKNTPRSIVPPLPQVPASRPAQEKKTRLEKEIAQLIHGDGALTNAPLLFESQFQASPPGNKKRKLHDETMPVPQRETRSQAKRLKKAPPAVDAVETVEQTKSTIKAATRTTRRPQKPATARNVRTAGQQKSPEAALPLASELPSLLPSSSTSSIQADSQLASHRSRNPTVPSRPEKNIEPTDRATVSAKTSAPAKEPPKQKEHDDQRVPQRRRRIEQDDSMEEFLAQCRAAAAI